MPYNETEIAQNRSITKEQEIAIYICFSLPLWIVLFILCGSCITSGVICIMGELTKKIKTLILLLAWFLYLKRQNSSMISDLGGYFV
jgi:hypothetical protein